MSFIGVDIGSQSTKTCVVSTEGEVLASSSFSYEICYPNPGWAEEDANLWWEGVKETIKDVLKKVPPRDIQAIAFSGQSPTILPLDKNGDPLMPAIIWCDSRSIEECNIVDKRIGGKRVFEISGNRIDPYFGGNKLLWLKRNRPEVYSQTWKVCQSHGYPIFKLTGMMVTDYSVAGLCSPIYDYSKKGWSDELCNELGLDIDMLPKIMPSSSVAGEVTYDAAEEVGLRKGTPVIVGGGDFATSILSVGAVGEGDASIMLGTACNFIIPMSSPKFDERLLGTSHVVKDTYAVIGSSYGGGILRWMKDRILDAEANSLKGSGRSLYEYMDSEASNLPAGSESLILFPYFVGGLTPIWNPHARGVYFGLTPKHNKAHLYRAVLEAVGYSFLYTANIVGEKGIHPKMIYGVDGGARSRLWRQILSDILDIPVAYVKDNIGAPVGDAALAGVGIGQFKDEAIVKDWVKVSEINYPDEEDHKKYEKYYHIYRELYERIKDLFALL